jgi:phosphoenolpyruvate carboxykinase (ATP)
MSIAARIDQLLHKHNRIFLNPARRRIIEEVVANQEAMISACGALATWSKPNSVDYNPHAAAIVRRDENEGLIEWDSPNNRSITSETFDMLVDDALNNLTHSEKIYVIDRVVGADSSWTLPLRVITNQALTALVADNLFRLAPSDLKRSVFYRQTFTILALPKDQLDPKRYQNRLCTAPNSEQPDTMALATDFERQLGILFGSTYCGNLKQFVFSAMSYLLPHQGILPLHSAASEGQNGDLTLFLGPSGTGKTILSVNSHRFLLGDDQIGWSANGVAGFEAGCYPMLADLNEQKAPEIFRTLFRKADYREHGGLIENALLYADGTFDFNDHRLTSNVRGLFPVNFLPKIKEPPLGNHPRTILLLTTDTQGVLPPVACLNHEQAALWLLMGYTGAVANEEAGSSSARAVFNALRFLCHPKKYATLFVDRLKQAMPDVYLINTGWTGGPYGVGKRIELQLSRTIIQAAIDGALRDIPCDQDPLFHFRIPRTCPGVTEPAILLPKHTWADKAAYDACAKQLSEEFRAHFEQLYENKDLPPALRAQCPGK